VELTGGAVGAANDVGLALGDSALSDVVERTR
jgi:L-aspartate oxidase